MALLSLSLCLVSVILSLVTSPATGSCKTSRVKLKKNGYTGIVVAIHEDEPENPELIEVIKEMFTSGSEYLYTATKKRAYFKEVTILIPLSWPDRSNYTAPGDARYEWADIIVADYNSRYSPGGPNYAFPYTKQFAGCGEQSLYIHFTPSFLLNADRWSPVVGDYGRVLVHEWGHYRWGLFNEYPDHITDKDQAQDFYHSETRQTWEPVSCSRDWKFTPLKYTGRSPNPYRPCKGDQTEGYENGCIMIPKKSQPPHVTGSVMHSHLNFQKIVNFCDKKGDPGNLHNSEAPTKQNQRCDGKSSWEVMREHPDFDGKKNNRPRVVRDVTPTFFVVRSKVMRIVLVLDTSGSMSTSDRHTKIADTARTYILTMAAPGTFIGIVAFDSGATIVSYLRKMTSDRRRDALANLVPEDANGNTCIGCGLDKAIKVLKAHGDPEGGKILLMTDCMDGDGESTKNALKKVIEKKVTIDIVAITDAEISQNIENLATKTGGQLYLQTDDSTSTGAREAANANAGMPSVFETRVEIESSVVVFDMGDLSFEGSVFIDETIGRLTTFDFTYFHTNPSGEAAVFITIMSPGERTFDRFQASYENDLAFKKVKIRIPGIAEPGEWTYYIYNQDTTVKHDVIVSVASYPSEEGVDPITVSSFVCGSLIGVVDNKPLVIYAEVKKRFDPVIGVKVIATVERPNADPVRLILLDNGAGADLTKNDGIYSKSFSQVLGVGLYGIKIRIENNGGAKILPYRSSLHSGTGIYLEPELLLSGNITEYLGNISIELPGAPIPEIAGVPAPNFTRGVSGGASSVSELPPEWNPSTDTFAPNKITDLAVLNTSFSMGTVAITFTASGDDFDFGNAHHYVIRWADSSQELRNKASTTNEIYQTDVLHGNLNSPAPYGDEEIMIIQVATVPQHLETYSVVLGLYAVDESDNEGDMSNTAKATFRKVIPTPEPIQTTTRTPTTETGDQSCKYLYHPFLGVFLSGDCED